MSDILRHPLTITILSFVLTGLIVPFLSRRFQEQRKALELKTSIVSDISHRTMAIVTAADLLERARETAEASSARDLVVRREHEYQDAVRDWEVESSRIWSTLEGYLARTGIPEAWWNFRQAISMYHAIASTDPQGRHEILLQQNDVLTKLGVSAHHQDVTDLRRELLLWKQRLIHEILHARQFSLTGRH